MKTLLWRALLIASMASIGCVAVGCADDADPADDGNNDVQPDPMPGNNPDPNPQPDPNPGPNPTPNPGVNPDPTPDPDPGPGPDMGECEENVTYVGQVFDNGDALNNDGSPNPNGGTPSFTPFTNDSGIQALLDAIPVIPDGEDSADAAVEMLQITGATVVAASFNSANQPAPRANRDFILADANGAIKVFFFADPVDPHTPFNIKVGQTVSVTVTQLTNFGGVPEITGVVPESWMLDAENQPVFIDDRTGGNIDATDVNKLIRVTGKLQDNGSPCGDPNLCFQFNYGGASDVILRSRPSQFIDLSQGACVTFVGPVSTFNGAAQLNVSNFDWLTGQRSE